MFLEVGRSWFKSQFCLILSHLHQLTALSTRLLLLRSEFFSVSLVGAIILWINNKIFIRIDRENERFWFYNPAGRALTWDVTGPISNPCSNEYLIFYAKWKNSKRRESPPLFGFDQKVHWGPEKPFLIKVSLNLLYSHKMFGLYWSIEIISAIVLTKSLALERPGWFFF